MLPKIIRASSSNHCTAAVARCSVRDEAAADVGNSVLRRQQDTLKCTGAGHDLQQLRGHGHRDEGRHVHGNILPRLLTTVPHTKHCSFCPVEQQDATTPCMVTFGEIFFEFDPTRCCHARAACERRHTSFARSSEKSSSSSSLGEARRGAWDLGSAPEGRTRRAIIQITSYLLYPVTW